MYFERKIKNLVTNSIQPNKVVVIYGPRRVGKTTLVNEIAQEINEPFLQVSGEDATIHEYLSSKSKEKHLQFLGSKRFLLIDEAQKIDRIGENLKLMVDLIPGIKIIATGSSSFELANQFGEPLVGRKHQFFLYPLAIQELRNSENIVETKARLEERLIYGFYPEVINSLDQINKIENLRDLVDNYLYRDLLEFEGIRKSTKILDLLRLLSFQVGSEVSLNELANNLNINLRTVEKYLDLLEKSFVVFSLRGFSKNLRKEVTKNRKYYFYDNGVRNSLINNYNSLKLRNDVGQLWENLIVSERQKFKEYNKIFANIFFWRTYDQKEIDYLEEYGGRLFAYELKWSVNKRTKPPKEFIEVYKEFNPEFQIINPENYLNFVS